MADRIAVLDHGRVAAYGSPSQLKTLVGGKVCGRPSRRFDLADLEVVSPSLDDVFSHLAGHGARA